MISKHTKKTALTIALVILFVGPVIACDLSKTPLTKDTLCSVFNQKDRELNRQYKSLSKKISLDEKSLLVKSQRKWLQWRDEKCDEIQEEIQCGNSLCIGVAHDKCILDLTSKRTSELTRFIENTAFGTESQFAFSQEYTYE